MATLQEALSDRPPASDEAPAPVAPVVPEPDVDDVDLDEVARFLSPNTAFCERTPGTRRVARVF